MGCPPVRGDNPRALADTFTFTGTTCQVSSDPRFSFI